MTHAQKSGVAHFVAENDRHCLLLIRELLSFLPSNNLDDPPTISNINDPYCYIESLNNLIPSNPKKPYDIKQLIRKIVDDDYFFEVHQHYARNIIVGFARFNGKSVGIVANQPEVLAGCLDIAASIKAARFVRFCDAFNIPLISLVSSLMFPDFYLEQIKSGTASSLTEPSFYMLMLKRLFQKLQSLQGKLMVELMMSWPPNIYVLM